MERNKNTTNDFFGLQDKSGNDGLFTDVNFPIDDALFWYDAGE
jgi:hypothetical protein